MIWDSSKIDLARLRVRECLLQYQEFGYAVVRTESLPAPRSAPLFRSDFLRTRRTSRRFGSISLVELSPFLWHAAHTCDVVEGAYGAVELRPSPSAGARHPLDLLLIDIERGGAFVYRPLSHGMDQIEADPRKLGDLADMVRGVLDPGNGLLLWLVAQPARTLAKYEHGEGFVLLDAGALVATLSFAAHATNIAYCPVGVSGEPYVSRMLKSDGTAIGVLGGVVGSRLE